jgi:hypothetical protein
MRVAPVLGLSIALCLTIGLSAQVPKSQQRGGTVPKKSSAAPPSGAAKPASPFDSLTEFSATMMGSLAGDEENERKIYRSGKLMRVEGLNKMSFFISNLDTNDLYATLQRPKLNKERCLHEVAPLLQTFPFVFFRANFKFQRTPAGEDEVEGHHCHVESVVRIGPSGGEMHVKFWEADDLKGFPIKIEVERAGKNTMTILYKDIKLASPDPALFKIPTNCTAGPSKTSSEQ